MLEAARRQFSQLGYDRTTMRSVATEAGVDQKLVGYFFGSKHALFVAATRLPFDPAGSMSGVLGGDPSGTGKRLARKTTEIAVKLKPKRWCRSAPTKAKAPQAVLASMNTARMTNRAHGLESTAT